MTSVRPARGPCRRAQRIQFCVGNSSTERRRTIRKPRRKRRGAGRCVNRNSPALTHVVIAQFAARSRFASCFAVERLCLSGFLPAPVKCETLRRNPSYARENGHTLPGRRQHVERRRTGGPTFLP